jgi:putative transposase
LRPYARRVPRPLRDQSAGFLHLVWRGNRRQRIFEDDVDRERFLELLAAACRSRGWRVLAWCLLTNHVHLLIEVPEGTLSAGMQWLGGRYAQLYNLRHGLDGHLFQGRFHAERVETLEYALEVGRYVDLNPERAGLGGAADWPWSSHRAHLGLARPRAFHDADWLARHFSSDPGRRPAAYGDYVAEARRRLQPRRAATATDVALRATSGGLTPGHGRDGRAPGVEQPQPP